MVKLKDLDGLIYMLQKEQEKEKKDFKIIEILRDKIQQRIIENNNILYGIK